MKIKDKLKSNKLILNIYTKFNKYYSIILCKISPKLASKKLYKNVKGKKLETKNPVTFNEKLMYLKLNNYNKNKNVFKCSDKFLIREYVKSKGISDKNLPKLLKVYNNANEIDFNDLPNKFVLKCSHGCGFNIVCQDKKKLNKNEAIKKLKKWQKTKFGFVTAEPHYTHIKPTLYCEEFIENDNGGFPNDYKLYCFNGEPKVVLVCSERSKQLKLNFFDMQWKELMIGTENYRSQKQIHKPKQFDEMIKIAKKISKEFPFVRVDFYEYRNKAILGEMTFTPAGCVAQYYTESGEIYLGNLLDLNK